MELGVSLTSLKLLREDLVTGYNDQIVNLLRIAVDEREGAVEAQEPLRIMTAYVHSILYLDSVIGSLEDDEN